jgi:hypothetical protein
MVSVGEYLGEQLFISGRILDTGALDLRGGLPADKFWARTTQDERVAYVINGSVSITNFYFYAKRDPGDTWTFRRPAYQITSVTTGGYSDSATLPPIIGDLSPLIDIQGYQFSPLRVSFDTSGGLSVLVNKGYHSGGLYDGGTIDLTASVPGTTGQARWVVVGINTVTNELVALNGTPITGSATDLDESTIDNISIPVGVMPLAAVGLQHGQTGLVQGSGILIDIRRHHDLGSGGGVDVTDTITAVQPATTLEFDPTYFGVTDAGSGVAEITITGGGAGEGSKLRVVGTVLYDNTLSSNGQWTVANADLISGAGVYADYDWLEIRAYKLRSTAAVTGDIIYLRAGTGGTLDTTEANYSWQTIGGDNATTVVGRGDNPLIAVCPGSGAGTLADSITDLKIELYAPASNKWKTAQSLYWRRTGATNSGIRYLGWDWENTAVIDILSLTTDNPGTDLFVAGARLQIIGYRRESIGGGGIDFAGLTLKTPPAFADEILINDAGVDKRTTLASTLDLFDTRSSPILLPGRRFKEKIVTSTGTVNNLDPENATVILLNNSSALTITGLAAGQPGQIIYLRSVGSANVFLEHQNTGSSASNRLINIVTSAASPLVAGKGHASYIYDGNSSRWRMLDHFQGGVIAFDMTWTSSGTAPTLGNGTKTSDYEIQRNMCFIQFAIVMGSTTTYGTGTWLFVMPINRVGGSTRNLVGQITDASAGLIRQVMNTWNSVVNIALAPDSASNIGPTVPWTWAVSDTIAVSGWYRIA